MNCETCHAQLPRPGFEPKVVNGHQTCGAMQCAVIALDREPGKVVAS